MSYTISFSDAVNKGTITVEDNTVNSQTSLQFPGKNTTSYGTIIAENFLHVLENFPLLLYHMMLCFFQEIVN